MFRGRTKHVTIKKALRLTLIILTFIDERPMHTPKLLLITNWLHKH